MFAFRQKIELISGQLHDSTIMTTIHGIFWGCKSAFGQLWNDSDGQHEINEKFEMDVVSELNAYLIQSECGLELKHRTTIPLAF